MPALLHIELRGADSLGKKFSEMQARMADLRPVGGAVLAAMRRGPGSVDEQFERGVENSLTGTTAWQRKHDFGSRLAPTKTLVSGGQLRNDWTGVGANSTSGVTANSFTTGVGSGNAYAKVFQSQAPTIIKPKKRGAKGRYSMFWYLGMKFGVWLSNARLAQGFVIQPRRVAINETMLSRVRRPVTRFIVDGTTAAEAA
jgi:hypothetical protein